MDADAIWREEAASDSKAIDLWNVLLMAMAHDVTDLKDVVLMAA